MPIRGGCALKGYLRVGISLVEVFERVGKSVILVSIKGPKELPIAFYGFENVEKRSGFVIYSYIKDSAFKELKRDVNF